MILIVRANGKKLEKNENILCKENFPIESIFFAAVMFSTRMLYSCCSKPLCTRYSFISEAPCTGGASCTKSIFFFLFTGAFILLVVGMFAGAHYRICRFFKSKTGSDHYTLFRKLFAAHFVYKSSLQLFAQPSLFRGITNPFCSCITSSSAQPAFGVTERACLPPAIHWQ